MEAKLEWRGKSDLTADDLLAPDAKAEGRTDIAEAVILRAINWLVVQSYRRTSWQPESSLSTRWRGRRRNWG
jgi:hypothetical protein